MTVAVCIASRGRPEELKHTVAKAKELATESETCFCAAVDRDDPEQIGYYRTRRIALSNGVREDSLGAKYNRAASLADKAASVFVLGVDDAYLASPGWDKTLLNAAAKFQDGIGVIYWGTRKGAYALPDGMAVTRGWIEKVGFFMPEHFPFWWHDTWVDELARMTGRWVWEDLAWEKYGSSEVNGHKTTRLREVSWWAKFFDDTRPKRMMKALDLLTTLDYPDWLRSQLISELGNTCAVLEQRNRLLRERGHEFEANYGAEVGDDQGYERLKKLAEEMVGR
jgi:hypothetical protein